MTLTALGIHFHYGKLKYIFVKFKYKIEIHDSLEIMLGEMTQEEEREA